MSLLVVLGYVWPEPTSSAAGWRMLSLLELYRAQGWQIVFASAAERGPHRVDLTKLGISEQTIHLNCSSFDQWIAGLQPDVVLFDRFMLEEQFGWRVEAACPQALRVLDSEDLHCLRAARQQAFKEKRPLQTTDLYSELAIREIAAILRCDLTLTISEFEMTLLQQTFQVPASQLVYCPFLQEYSGEAAVLPDFADRQHFIFIGNFRHEPNWQAVLWLQQIWPLIRTQLPKAELHIYGAYPPPKATALHNAKQGFLMKGWADDAAAVMQSARVCLAPLPFGAGLKGKLIDAMQNGTPSVTTAIGSEGMCLDGQFAGLVADGNQGIADAACVLYQDEQQWRCAQQQGFAILAQKFSKNKLEPAIWQQLEAARAQLSSHRSQLFFGLMLRQQQYRSSKFMGQWIEAKTRLAALEQQLSEAE
ncbi:glycosyltransferase [Rheinheimera sp.]|uniref:glycosyltransferase n=1 Tax=Rheinheimera sp. TaxID=1869214 RepID=UPI0027B89851|nr:glycosyltransferase [Rheinheimera sp.]